MRLVGRETATCQVLAESESPETYEATKANRGRPLHLWRLDYAVLNSSGQPLGQLTSKLPRCTSMASLFAIPWFGRGRNCEGSGTTAMSPLPRSHPEQEAAHVPDPTEG